MASEIIVSINVESGKAEVSLGKAKKGVDKLAAAKEKLAHSETQLAKDIALVNLKTKEQIQINNQAAAETLKNVNKSSGQFRTQVGLNNAILTEAGRAASDLRFGFNGVANNVGQIASLFGSLINTSDNVVTSLKNLGKSLLGTGGILIAIQLLIAYGDRIYNFFRGVTEAAVKAEKAMKKLEGTIQSQRLELLGYIEVLNDATVADNVRTNALKELNVVSKETIQDYKDGKIDLDELTLSVETYMKQQRLRGELDALLSSNQAVFAEREKVIRVQKQLDLAQEKGDTETLKKLYKENSSIFDQFFDISRKAEKAAGGKGYLPRLFGDSDIDFAGLFREQSKGVIDEANSAVKKMLEIEKQLTDNSGGAGGGPSAGRIRIFKEKTLELEKLEQQYREKSINKDLQTNQEKIAQFQQNEFAKLDILEEIFITRESLRLKNYIESVQNQKISDEKKLVLIADAEAKFTKEIEQAGEDRLKVEKQILLNSQLMRDIQARKDGETSRKLQEKEEQIREAFDLKKVELLRNSLGDDAIYFDSRAALLEDDIDRQQRITDSFTQGTVERAEAEVELFRLRDSLRQNDLNKEVAAIAEKTRVQQIYVGYVSGISGILKAVAGENEALQKTALVLEKGAAIAGIVVNANSSIAQSVANTGVANTAASALLSNPLTAIAGGIALARNKAALAKEVLMTKVSAGIGIASILATTLTSAKSPSGGEGGGGSGASVTAPSFNVVGASSTDQLAQAVGGQVNEPIRAYVVGGDVTSQQELERNIVNTAGIG